MGGPLGDGPPILGAASDKCMMRCLVSETNRETQANTRSRRRSAPAFRNAKKWHRSHPAKRGTPPATEIWFFYFFFRVLGGPIQKKDRSGALFGIASGIIVGPVEATLVVILCALKRSCISSARAFLCSALLSTEHAQAS